MAEYVGELDNSIIFQRNVPVDTLTNPNENYLYQRAVDNMLQHLLDFGFSQESDEEYISRLINEWDKEIDQAETYDVDEDVLTADVAPVPSLSIVSLRRSQRIENRKSNIDSLRPNSQGSP